MAATRSPSDFPPIRACLFDMDGLLLDTEGLITRVTDTMLAKHGRPKLPWSIKAQLQGRPAPAAYNILQEWAQLPVTPAEYQAEAAQIQRELFPTTKPLPGVEKLIGDLSHANPKVHLALATSSHQFTFKLKTEHLAKFFEVFDERRRVLGDDVRIPKGRGKPAPDIYLLALEMVNATLAEGEKKIAPEECLVFEDSVPGVEAGRRAGMRVIWCPHPELLGEFEGREAEVLAGRADAEGLGLDDGRGELNDGWGQHLATLENFPYERYGIKVKV